jgi:hypothetical protein
MGKIYIITVVTDTKYYFPYLKKSCKKHGIELIVLGYGEKWKGFNWRSKLIIDFISKLYDDDIICIIDGYDVLCVRNLIELKNIFINIQKNTNCKMIVGHDKILNNLIGTYTIPFFFGTCKKTSINIGTYIGYTKDIIYILNNILSMNSKDDADDQVLITKYCNLYPNDIYIDIYNEIFLTIDSPLKNITEFIDIDNNNNIIFEGRRPFFIHGPGSTYLDNLVEKLEGVNPNQNNDFKNKYFNLIFSYILKYIIYPFIFILFIFLFLFLIIKYFFYKKKNKY